MVFFINCSRTIFKLNLYTMSRYDELTSLVEGLGSDFAKFYDKGNKAAGTRVRKGMQTLKVWAQDVRKEVQAKKNAS